MFTGIITDVGRILEIGEDDGRRMTIETRLPLAEIPLGGSIATSGICFTAVDKGEGWFTVQASGATLEVTTAGPLGEGRSRSISSARCGSATSSAATSCSAMSMRSARSWRSSRWASRTAWRSRVPAHAGAADRGQGLDRGRRHLAHRQRDRRRPLRRQHHPAQLDAHQSAGARRGRRRQHRGRHARPLRRPPARVPRPGLITMPFAEYLSTDRGDSRGRPQRPHVHPGRRREPRERGRSGDPRRALRRRGDQLHGQARPRPDLPRADPPAGRGARPAADGARQRIPPLDRVHGQHRGARGDHHRASRRPTGRAPSRSRSTPRRPGPTCRSPATSSR